MRNHKFLALFTILMTLALLSPSTALAFGKAKVRPAQASSSYCPGGAVQSSETCSPASCEPSADCVKVSCDSKADCDRIEGSKAGAKASRLKASSAAEARMATVKTTQSDN